MGIRASMRLAAAFTFLEVMVVVVMIGILAAVVVPSFSGITEDAKSSSLQGTLGGVRSSIASFRAKAVLAGTAPYPTLAQLTAAGTVLQQELPVNPYSTVGGVQAVSKAQADARSVTGAQTCGWNYYVDNTTDPASAIFYANSTATTNVSDGHGGFKTANQL